MASNTKLKKILLYILIWAISASVGTYFRVYPLRSFSSDDSSEKASVYVIARIKSNFDKQVNSTYPNMPQQQKDILSKQLFDKLIKTKGEKIHEAIDKLSKNIQKNSSKTEYTPYLLASDSFYYFGLTKNIVKTGSISDSFKGSKYLNRKMLAPIGHWEPLNLHPYVGFSIYSILKMFYPNISLMHAVSYTPIVISIISLIFYILACVALKCEAPFIFLGSIFFMLAKIFVKRSTFGWYDNDPYNILFPLIILSLIFFAINNLYQHIKPKKFKRIIIPSLLSSAIFMLYSFFWQGWVFLFSIVCFSAIVFFLASHLIFKKSPSLKSVNHFFLSMIFFSFFFIGLSFGFSDFFKLFNEGWVALKDFLSPQLSIWPDLYISVGELKKTNLNEMIGLCGGGLFFIISMLGLSCSILDAYIKKSLEKLYSVLIILFFLIGSIVIALGAQRFAILCLVPISLGFPLGLKYIYILFTKLIKNSLFGRQYITLFVKGAFILLLASTIIIPINNIHRSMPFLLNRIYNDTWNKVMLDLKKNTPKDSIITTWWPPGHFIKAIAERRVTFDGATINVPQAYWIANIFLSQDERKALGMLRMLNDSANEASAYINSLGIPISTTVLMLKEITDESKEQALKNISKVIKDGDEINHLLDLTHKKPPPSYLLLYNEFVENNIQLSFLGKWNFKAIENINSNAKLLKKVPKRKSPDYIDFLWKLVGGPHKYSGKLGQIGSGGENMLFQEGVEINVKTKECRISSPKYGTGIPKSIFYLDGEKIIEKELPNSRLNYSVVLYKEGNATNCILMDRFIANSLFVKLFFFDGKGLKYIKPFIKKSDLTKRTQISVFKIDWNAFEKDTE